MIFTTSASIRALHGKVASVALPCLIEAWPSLHWGYSSDGWMAIIEGQTQQRDGAPTILIGIDGSGRCQFSLSAGVAPDDYLREEDAEVCASEYDKIDRHIKAWLERPRADPCFHGAAAQFLSAYGVHPNY